MIEVSRVRQPEMGAADGGRRRGVRGIVASAGHSLHRARAESSRARARVAARRRPKSRSSPPSTETFSRKNINQSIDESLATYKAVCDRAIARGSARARLPVDGVRLSVRGRRSRPRRSPTSPRASPTSASSRSPSATRSASRIRARSRAVLEAVLARLPADRRGAAFPRHARDRARQRADALPSASRRSTHRPAASAAARMRRARPATWPPTI